MIAAGASPSMREHDIRPAEVFEKYLELTRADAETFFADRAAFEEAACTGCGRVNAAEAFVKAGFRYVQCGDCGTLFVSPRPPRRALDAFYGDSPSATYWADTFFPASMEARREKLFVPRVERILALMDERRASLASTIDVGAGFGIFLEELRRRCPSVETLAIEPGLKLAAVCRQKGLETLERPVEDAEAWAARADLVTCFEVIEHVHSPAAFTRALARLVKPGGYLLVTTLCVDGFDIQTLWERSNSVSPPHHLNFMSVRGFESLFERSGLERVEVLTPGRLDVDIVRNACAADPSLLETHRFLRVLFERGAETQKAFQQFLADHRLSSHAWVLAQKPAT